MDDQVTLEAYADENRALIHSGRHDEAIAICKHILHYYPKHIDSYRQLGEAYLEKEELDPAAEMFRRVLSADPENVIAYVGLATIFEQQHLPAEAVWHLERAYEIAPGNFEISKELLRMYSEADAPRHRLKLTPAGLARLYAQEGLYPQAIQELRAISTATPARFDARVALAETLWQTDRIREAAEVAQGVLTLLPYCLKANLIVGAAWKESGLPDSETYLSRAQELDPTNKVAQRLFGARSPLDVAQIAVPRYVEGVPPPPMPSPTPPALDQIEPSEAPVEEAELAAKDFFAETPTVQAEPSEAEIAAADFFAETPTVQTETAEETAQPAVPIEMEPTPRPDLPVAKLPSWLLSEFPESAQAESPAPSEVKPPREETEQEITPLGQETAPNIQESGLPEWLTGRPTAESTQAAAPESVEPEAEKMPPWLEGAGETTPSTLTAEGQAEPAESAKMEEVPDWMRELQAPTAPTEETLPAQPEPATPSEEYVLPDFLAQPPAETKPIAEQPTADLQAVPFQPVEPAEEPVAEEAPPAVELAAEAPTETVAEMPPAPADVQAAPSIVVEMPSSEGAAQPPAEAPAEGTAAAPIPKRKRQPKGYPHLILAREHRDASRTEDALVEYDWLVQHAPRLVGSVIDDLEGLTARPDAPLEAHRILGDAYTRADRLPEALQRYHFVLERKSSS